MTPRQVAKVALMAPILKQAIPLGGETTPDRDQLAFVEREDDQRDDRRIEKREAEAKNEQNEPGLTMHDYSAPSICLS